MFVSSSLSARSGVAAALALCLAACAVGPAYQRPKLAPAVNLAEAHAPSPLPDTGWWRHFNAPDLDRLIDSAARQSPDLAAAIARIEQADAALSIAAAPLLPSLTADAGQDWTRAGDAGTPAARAGSRYSDSRNFSGKIAASWELDIWGQTRAARDAARANLLAARADRDAVWLSTSAAIATTYFSVLTDAERLAIARNNLRDQEEILAAFRARLDAGTASALDVSQQEALAAGTRAKLPAFDNNFRSDLYALSVLTGLPPEAITVTPASLAKLGHPVIGADLPATLLHRRPDLVAAEEKLIGQNETLRQNIAAYYPSLSLTASGGVSSLALAAITGPGSLAASFGSSLAQTIFDNGAKAGAVAEARGVYHELAADYAKTWLTALADTETALAAVRLTAEQEALQQEAATTARRAADIAHAQMEVGTVDIVTVLNTETTLFTDEDALAQIRGSRLQAIVSLYKALGGGWDKDSLKK